jgi:hypothetical protein
MMHQTKGLKVWALAWGLMLTLASWAQDASVQVTVDRNRVMRGDNIQLTFAFNNCSAQIGTPKIEGLRYAFGPSQSTNVSIVNGRRSDKKVLTFTYIVTATSDIAIPRFEMTTNKGVMTSTPFTIQVIKSREPTNRTADAILDREVAMIIDLPKGEVFVGEPLIATLQIYTLIPGLEVRNYTRPEFSGFWKEPIEIPNPSFRERVLNGRSVQLATVGEFVLFPQQTGELTIEGFDLTGYIRTSFFQGREISASADPVKVQVNPLPSPIPPNHLGAFNQLEAQLKISETTVEANQAFTVDLTFRGNGNLKFIQEPTWNWPADFEVFDPEVKDNIKIDSNGESGRRTFHYVVIPRATGSFSVPPLDVSWFDAKRKEHVRRELGGEALEVQAAEGDQAATMSYNSKSDIQVLNQDIRYIQLEATECFTPIGEGSWKKSMLAGAMAIGPLQLILLLWYRRKKEEEASDVRGTRKKQAKSQIRKELREAAKMLSHPPAFYEALGKGLESYLMAKLGWTASQFTRKGALQALERHAPSSLPKWTSLLEQIDLARFATNLAADPQSLYKLASALVDETEKEWKA